MSESKRNKIRHDVVSQDEYKVQRDQFKSRSYPFSSESDPLDTFYKYYANRNDANLFASSSLNESRTQIQDAIYTEYNKDLINATKLKESNNSYTYNQGENTNEQKVYGYVFEETKRNPNSTVTFTQLDLPLTASKSGLNIRNIKIFGSNIGVKNSYMPATVIVPSDFQGYRSQLSSSGVTTAYDITKIHHEGDIKASLQSPFTNQHVGGYIHRHLPINTGSDNSSNRPEMVAVSASGNTINFTRPAGLKILFSREGAAKRVVNTRRIKTVDSRIAGNYSKNYEVFSATNRNENNLWLRSNPTASFTPIDSIYISGTQDTETQTFQLGDGTNTEMIFVQKFGAPGGPESNAAVYQDSTSRQFSPYNTVNYRNPTIRYYLNKQFLVNHADYAGYTTAGYGLTASFHNIQRNPSYYTGSSGIYKKYDNMFVKREIPASPRGYRWIGTRFGTGSFDNGVFVKDYNDPRITFLSKSIDRDVYFERVSLNSEQLQLIASSTYFTDTYAGSDKIVDNFGYGIKFTAADSQSLNTFLVSRNKLFGYSTKNQINNYYHPVRIAARKGVISYDGVYNPAFFPNTELSIANYVGDTDENGKFVFFPHSPINNKYENVVVEYQLENGNKEQISLPFASNYAYLGDFFNTSSMKMDHLYKDERNIRYANKNNSLFFKILDNDNDRRKNNIQFPKINKIKYKEKVWPKVANTFLRRNRNRSYISQVIIWDNNELERNELLAFPGDFYDPQGTKTNRSNIIYPEQWLSLSSISWRPLIWPMDAFSTSSGDQFLDKSGRMMNLDNPTFISSAYPGVGYPSHLPPSGAYVNLINFGRNWNINRPKNVVFEQANSYPYYENYESIDYDARYNFKNYGNMFAYNSDINLNYYLLAGQDNPPADYESDSDYNRFSCHTSNFNRLETTDIQAGDPFVLQKGLENNIFSDYVDLLYDFNKNEDMKISKIKFDINTVKKFFNFSNIGTYGVQSKVLSNNIPLYPAERLSYGLALNFRTYYVNDTPPAQPGFTFTGSVGGVTWKKPALSTFFMPGIACNSIKAGVGLPFSAVTSLPTINIASGSNSITASLNAENYTKVPFEAILDPSKIAGVQIYDADPDLKVYNYLTASAILNPGFKNDQAYKDLANNFFAETVNFYIKDGRLPRLKSKPQNEWYFGDLNKPYSMKLLIFKSNNFDTYTSKESYGPRPYIYHNPPWMTFSGDATLTGSNSVTQSTFNSDTMMAPSASYKNSSYAIATITFDPRLVTASSQINVGKGAQFSFNEIKRYSTVTYQSSFIDSTAIASAAINLGDCAEIFGFSEKDETWTPYIKWVCPTANLNFYNTSYGKLTQSNSNDSGQNAPGSAIRGIWHQLGIDVDENTGLFFQAADNSSATTGSLLDVVGFNSKEKVRIGEVASSKTIEEGVVILPVYLENNSEEKLIELNIEKFEKNYSNSIYIKSIDDFSKKFVLPPLLDFMKVRRKSNFSLTKSQYGKITPPILMFFAEFKSKILRSDLLRIWQGLMPETAKIMEIDNKNLEFDLKNNEIFSYDDLVKFGNTLPTNLRFKIFKVHRRAVTNYQDIIDRTLDREVKEDYRLTTSWPYSSFEFVNRAEVKVGLEYDKTFGVPKGSHVMDDGTIMKDEDMK